MLEPRQIAVIHVGGHQKGNSFEAIGNRIADEEAKRAGVKAKTSNIFLLLLGIAVAYWAREEWAPILCPKGRQLMK